MDEKPDRPTNRGRLINPCTPQILLESLDGIALASAE
jgi:hypothetical protein